MIALKEALVLKVVSSSANQGSLHLLVPANGMLHPYAWLVLLQFVTELKAVLKHTMAEPLGAELGMTLADSQQADLRLALTWLHPGSMSEADFLFPDGQKHSRGYKRKRGQGKVAREAPGG